MAQVTIALGSNLDDPHAQLRKAKEFLSALSPSGINASPIYRSEPVGPSESDFLNAVVSVRTGLTPQELFEQLKAQEKAQGRPSRYPKWTARTIDLDIIGFDDLALQTDSLIIPHKEYANRKFVLLPLKDIFPDWRDPVSAQHIDELIEKAPDMRISKTDLNW